MQRESLPPPARRNTPTAAQRHPAPSIESPSLSSTQSSPDNYSLADFVQPGTYLKDPVMDWRYRKAVREFQHAGPVFARQDGVRVSFNDLEWEVQCGMIHAAVRPIKDKMAFQAGMSTDGAAQGQLAGIGAHSGAMDIETKHVNDAGNVGARGRLSAGATHDMQQRNGAGTPALPCGAASEGSVMLDSRRDSTLRRDGISPILKPQEIQARIPRGRTSGSASHQSNCGSSRVNVPHETLLYTSPDLSIMRRVVGTASIWQTPRTRLSHSARLLQELGVHGACTPQPRMQAVGNLQSTLGEAMALGV